MYAVYVSKRDVLGKLLLEKYIVFIFLGHQRKMLWSFVWLYPGGVFKTAFYVFRGALCRFCPGKNKIFPSSEVDCRICCLLTFFRRRCKNCFLRVSEEHFVGFFSENNVIFTFCEYDGKKSYLLTIFQRGCQNCFQHVRRNNSRNNNFSPEKIQFWSVCGPWRETFRALAEILWLGCHDNFFCIQKNILRIKKFCSQSEIFRRVVIYVAYVSRWDFSRK